MRTCEHVAANIRPRRRTFTRPLPGPPVLDIATLKTVAVPQTAISSRNIGLTRGGGTAKVRQGVVSIDARFSRKTEAARRAAARLFRDDAKR